MPVSHQRSHFRTHRLAAAAGWVLLGCLSVALGLQTVLGEFRLARTLMSRGLWARTVERLGGQLQLTAADGATAEVGFLSVLMPVAVVAVLGWTLGAWGIARRSQQPFLDSLVSWGRSGWLWWLIPGAWELLRIGTALGGWAGALASLETTPQMGSALALAGWIATWGSLSSMTGGSRQEAGRRRPDALLTASGRLPPEPPGRRRLFGSIPRPVWVAVGLYVLIFTAMNWQLYRGLLVPHGDSAMYEEHLWNLTHGKGFRSYLDQGLFLGEHIQVIHVLLVPIYLLWPSHLLLELCESVALASGAIPVFWMARRHTGSVKTAGFLAAAYLLYFPLQFLDIAVDLKTFRPISFGVPVMLFALDQLERGRTGRTLLLLLLALSAKEDYALVIAPLGLWWALRSGFEPQSGVAGPGPKASPGRVARPESAKGVESAAPGHAHPVGLGVPPGRDAAEQQFQGENRTADSSSPQQTNRLPGFALAGFSVLYLLLVTTVVIPWFRGGDEVHYTRYFSKFGDSAGEVAQTMLTEPGLLAGELLTAQTAITALAFLLPLGFLPLLSPGRLAVGLPVFVLLCLNEVTQSPYPWHHFHAPLVPVLFWAAAAGLGRLHSVKTTMGGTLRPPGWAWPGAADSTPFADSGRATHGRPTAETAAARFAFAAALATGLFFSLSPLGIAFWDPGSAFHWKRLYVPGKRAELFPRVYRRIPKDARVASTDFVHPRFTHHERSYDYSNYRRKVSDYELRVPDDTDYIVIDTQHPYSEIKTPQQVREYREHPERWELLPDVTDGYFLVFKRTDSQ